MESSRYFIRRWLEEQDINVTECLVPNTLQLQNFTGKNTPPLAQIITAVPLQTKKGLLLAMFPSDSVLQDSVLNDVVPDKFSVPTEISLIQEGMELLFGNAYLPALAPTFGATAVIDTSIEKLKEVYIWLDDKTLVKLAQEQWRALQGSDPLVHRLAKPYKSWQKQQRNLELLSEDAIQLSIQAGIDFPPIPAIAQQILQLQSNPNADAETLSSLVEKDPTLAAQVVSWASSPYYGFPGQIKSVQDAIVNVLGFDVVMNLALGLAIGHSLKVPVNGALGLEAYWRHSVYCATLVENLVKAMPGVDRPSSGLAYLSGLLHNFGFLFVGHVFSGHFKVINQCAGLNPHIPITQLQNDLLGTKHEQIGAWMMQAWHIPAEVIAASLFHHDPSYDKEHAVYAQLVNVAVQTLKHADLGGDGTLEAIDELQLTKLNLDRGKITSACENLLQKRLELADLSNQLSGN